MRLFFLSLVLFSIALGKQCETSEYSCPDSSTCCKLEDGEWGCCPMKNAVCCEDHVHCCPEGNTCNVQEAKCIQGHLETPFQKKHRAVKKNRYNEIECPDHKNKCPEGSTCCQTIGARYGCCPAPEATCCADHLHCCPHGMRCDPSGQRCVDDEGWTAIPWLKKFSSTPIRRKSSIDTHRPMRVDDFLPKELQRVPCGEGMTCPAMTTCCHSNKPGKSTCCPLQNGVCCSDFCCPDGWQCVEGQDRCERAAQADPFRQY